MKPIITVIKKKKERKWENAGEPAAWESDEVGWKEVGLFSRAGFFCSSVSFSFFLPKPQDGHLRHVSGLALTLQCQDVSQFLEIPGFIGDSGL